MIRVESVAVLDYTCDETKKCCSALDYAYNEPKVIKKSRDVLDYTYEVDKELRDECIGLCTRDKLRHKLS